MSTNTPGVLSFDDVAIRVLAALDDHYASYCKLPSAVHWRSLQAWLLAHQQIVFVFRMEGERDALCTALSSREALYWPEIIVQAATGETIADMISY